ncbi:MAG: outer membrane lipoprotein carrier protein LolA [Cyclobacteriaceae bacterium]
MKYFFTVLSTLIYMSSFSQYDPEAKTHLDKLSAAFKSYTSFEASFTYHLDGPSDLDEKYAGTITVKGDNFKLTTDNGMDVVCDGSNICNFNKEDEEVTMYEYDTSEDGIMTPTKVADMYKDGYRYRMIEGVTLGGVACYGVELSPDLSPQERDKEPVTKIKLYIKKTDGTLKRWQIFERTGNKYTVTINSLKPNVTTTSMTFKCAKDAFPEGIDFNDLR